MGWEVHFDHLRMVMAMWQPVELALFTTITPARRDKVQMRLKALPGLVYTVGITRWHVQARLQREASLCAHP